MKPSVAAAILTSLLSVGTLLAQTQQRPVTVSLAPAVESQCVELLRGALNSGEFWPSMHAAEALTLAGKTDEVRATLAPLLPKERDDQRRCGLARELRARRRSRSTGNPGTNPGGCQFDGPRPCGRELLQTGRDCWRRSFARLTSKARIDRCNFGPPPRWPDRETRHAWPSCGLRCAPTRPPTAAPRRLRWLAWVTRMTSDRWQARW